MFDSNVVICYQVKKAKDMRQNFLSQIQKRRCGYGKVRKRSQPKAV